MKPVRILQSGYTLVELLVAMSIGVILIGAVIATYVTQTQTYNTTSSQAATQNAENAIAAVVTPIIRATGFVGCLTNSQPVPNLNAGG
ncbi:MAG: prepilin-type N-terminal cleavage/methylation domain-containing protein, partial [Rhodoferax sp.]